MFATLNICREIEAGTASGKLTLILMVDRPRLEAEAREPRRSVVCLQSLPTPSARFRVNDRSLGLASVVITN